MPKGIYLHKKGENHYNWKGNKISKMGVHSWIRNRYGQPEKCDFCGIKGERKNGDWTIQWANKKPYRYLRNRNDWLNLCYPCHRQYDTELFQDMHGNNNPMRRPEIAEKVSRKLLGNKIKTGFLKLKRLQIEEIQAKFKSQEWQKNKHKKFSQKNLAKFYGVSDVTIRKVLKIRPDEMSGFW